MGSNVCVIKKIVRHEECYARYIFLKKDLLFWEEWKKGGSDLSSFDIFLLSFFFFINITLQWENLNA